MYIYTGMCIHIFISIYVCNDTLIQIHTYKQNVFMLCHIAMFCSWAKRLGVLVPPCENLITEVSWYVHHWNQHGLVFECGVFCKLIFESLQILHEFVGAVKHHAQHCI